MQRNLALELVRVTEVRLFDIASNVNGGELLRADAESAFPAPQAAALAGGRFLGRGDKNAADQVTRRFTASNFAQHWMRIVAVAVAVLLLGWRIAVAGMVVPHRSAFSSGLAGAQSAVLRSHWAGGSGPNAQGAQQRRHGRRRGHR